jgi:aldehyde:ferredoxin oxidoreductase
MQKCIIPIILVDMHNISLNKYKEEEFHYTALRLSKTSSRSCWYNSLAYCPWQWGRNKASCKALLKLITSTANCSSYEKAKSNISNISTWNNFIHGWQITCQNNPERARIFDPTPLKKNMSQDRKLTTFKFHREIGNFLYWILTVMKLYI